MTTSRRTVLGWLLAAVALLSGCVAVPTSGPVERIQGQEPACQNCVNVDVDPPSPGDDPVQVVEGYLRATSNYQPNYSVAKQFLTRAAAQKWSPEAGVAIYTGSPSANGGSVILDGKLLGSLGPDRTYTARDSRLLVDFGVVREDGNWRINRPPPGLLVADYAFTSFYQPYNLYFIGSGGSLVPDLIYLPNLRNQAGIASVLMKELLAGPSVWLKPAVTSAVPAHTELRVDSVTVANGIADVPLSESVLQLNDQQRTLLAAQVLYTLRQASGVNGVLFTVNEQPFRVPGSDQNSVVTIDAIPREMEPIPSTAGDQLYALRGKGVQLVSNDGTSTRPIPGPMGAGRYAIDSLAVSVANTDLAAVTDRRTTLRTAAISGGDAKTVLTRATGLLRPQFSRFGELWAIGQSQGRQQLWVFAGNKRTRIDAAFFRGSTVTAFKLSPDGARMALVRRVGATYQLGLARISRSDKVSVDGWRAIDVTTSGGPNLSRIADVGWLDATELIVLGGPVGEAGLSAYRLSQDASTITAQGEPTSWEAGQVTVLLRTQTAVVVARNGQAWKDDGSGWRPFLDKVKTVAYPG